MDVPSPAALLDLLRALPSARPLLSRLADVPGVYVVGGAVRDLLQGGEPYDLDLVVEGDAAALARRLGPARVHDRFGTSTVTIDGFVYDIARARTERYPHPGALPEVAPAPLAEDLLRRDFTVNAIAAALGGAGAGELQYAPRALEDLEASRLRVLHDRSFLDDPTRLLRLARYAARLDFAIEPRTLELALAAVRASALTTVSGPRIGAELRLCAREADPMSAFAQLRALGLDAAIDEQFGLAEPELARRALELLPADGRRDLVVLGVAARGMRDPALRQLLDRLAFEAHDREVIAVTALRADAVAEALARAEKASRIADVLTGAEPELVAVAGGLHPAVMDRARAWLDHLRHVRLEIDGNDLLEAGVPEGPGIGVGLHAALAAKLDGAGGGRSAELERAVQAARASG